MPKYYLKFQEYLEDSLPSSNCGEVGGEFFFFFFFTGSDSPLTFAGMLAEKESHKGMH